jgi:hypothetical protein
MIFRKDHIENEVRKMREHVHALMRTLEGGRPHDNLATDYHSNSADFPRDYVEIDLERLKREIDLCTTMAKSLKTLKRLAANPVHRR